MFAAKTVGKREFIQHTSKYIKWVEQEGKELIITHKHKPDIVLTKIKQKSLEDLQGLTQATICGDINDPILPGYDQW